jgi:hypothetical protein
LALSTQVTDHLAEIGLANDFVLLEPSDPEIYSWLPSASFLRVVSEKIATDPDLKLKKIFDSANTLHHIALYERRPPFEGVRAVEGFLPTEGPFPQWKLSFVRWASGEEARLERTSTEHSSLYLKGRSSVAGQSIQVNVDGHPVGICHLPEPWVTRECEIAIPADFQANEITLKFSRRGPQDQKYHPVLFEKIQML